MTTPTPPSTWKMPVNSNKRVSSRAFNRPIWHLHPQESEVIKRIKTEGRIKVCSQQKTHKED